MSKYRKYDWPALFSEFEKSDLSQTDFCKARNLNPRYFNQQLSRHRKTSASPFTKAKIPPTIERDIILTVGALRVSIPTSVDPSYTGRLIKALA